MISSKVTAVLVAVTVCVVLQHVTQGQQQPPQPGQLGPCSRGLDADLPGQCLTANGIDYNGTIFLITGNRSGTLPPGVSYEDFRDLMCSTEKQDMVVPCVLKLIQKWNQTQCTDQDKFLMANKGGQLLALMEVLCREPCETAATQTLVQCFAAVQVDPSSILNQNATIITDKFQFAGNDSDSASKFCSSRQRLFSCLSPLRSGCPKTIDRLYTLGVDLEGLELATQAQCQDIDGYLDAQKCFASQAPAIQQCGQETDLLFAQVQEERYRTGVTRPSQFMGRLCQTKLNKVDCLLRNYEGICGAPAAELMSSFECTSMPKPCRTDSETLPVYKSLCQTVSTPSPTVTVRPTPPPKPKPGSKGPTSGTAGGEVVQTGGSSGGDDNGVAAVACSFGVMVLSVVMTAVVTIM